MLNKSDYNDITMLINISSSICRNFQELCQLEIAGKKESQEYQEYLEEVTRDVEYKNTFLNRLTTTPEKCIEVMNYIKKLSRFKNVKYASDYHISFISTTSNLSEDERVLAYLLNQLTKIILDNPQFLMSNIMKNLNLPEILQNQTEVYNAFQFTYQALLIADIYNLFLALNERRINNTQNSFAKQSFIKSKYQYGLLIPYIADSLIKSRFNAEMHPFLISHNARIMHPVVKEFEDLIKKNILLENAEKRMDEITNYNDLELMNPETLAHVLNAQDLLRSVLILADEETTQAITCTIEDILKSAKETNLSINIKLICQILEEVIKRIPEDKTIPQIVSFGRI